MTFTRIDGTLSVVGAAPDGDSVRFTPNRADAWRAAGLAVRANPHGGVQLRLDAIDALETHYAPPQRTSAAMLHQPLPLAHAAAEELLRLVGFTAVSRGADEVVTAVTPATVAASILTSGVDTYGRCVAFLLPAGAPLLGGDGTRVRVAPADLSPSANAQLLATGLAYPTFYSGLYADLRTSLAGLASAARDARSGVWAEDRTTAGVEVTSLQVLTDSAVILPKLFRRLAEYLALGSTSMAGFRAFLDARGDRVLVLPRGEVAPVSSVVAVDGEVVRLTTQPDDLVFFEG
ncbi:hypothetical protein EV189_2219 [Motilibacter rhizosphaerae]|uniref:Nuclease n=1 Tax=Motilibacter rhizosphaerae TaxID=598652 RepID=A0A4Q7NNR1_9ACTN|nr:nuclease [Motilibacter rhizosphaerae]RZS86803.1 hypothetical protein EV189_2219 [Motilibacter rhizosphaerae]